ncbi:MAG: PIN domain nuclease [Zetaproteobacteria bacterium CG_4_9_14_3_um_filter_49_83]|nr:MAG: twitching motility protein PilT [Zetaproteobacteria bacterium CG1_02_49_23]PIQ31241.1 MAG: PIN domain nuclease [Zetaproteobacteria bacterium CG17_big_fil_post_rev_8_21_14_2_50_50_13]PIV30099.1 MAG: PIN domain nuclease [Zetaproteobacteria bacterium CG02_land_8_20_14_3_00_50_9]PIY55547.1 MAG: PIN domain nuclease [Zetaproteobacteria bacterium CG_4_10_14_0_8_um_filter_49_80]PJA35121.1 MAG: PIN domain nuclease [Zetaproteobacteria bacterium CG_4_9_14_3_um_filter_49_83]
MKVLLDTHVFIWLLEDAPQLSQRARDTFTNPDNELFFSAASYWEICIKISLGKLELASDWGKIVHRELAHNNIGWLAIEPEHMQGILSLPMHHRDPFDRLLIAQAACESMSILSADQHFSSYDIPVIW